MFPLTEKEGPDVTTLFEIGFVVLIGAFVTILVLSAFFGLRQGKQVKELVRANILWVFAAVFSFIGFQLLSGEEPQTALQRETPYNKDLDPDRDPFQEVKGDELKPSGSEEPAQENEEAPAGEEPASGSGGR